MWDDALNFKTQPKKPGFAGGNGIFLGLPKKRKRGGGGEGGRSR